MIGQTLTHYRITERLGAGGMGEVYRARDARLDRDVALKVLPPGSFHDPAARERLLGEARAAAALNHPHICTIYEVGEADGQAYIAMELVEGEPLSSKLARGALPPEDVLRLGQQIASAVAHAHDRGVVHRDLKCANVVLTADGRAKVLDFGLAQRLSENELDEVTRSVATPGKVEGTLAYMAPEQLQGRAADARSDVWSLGVVFYEMAAGARPFSGATGYALSSAILNQPALPPPAGVPAGLRAVMERCLQKEPAQRYARAGEVAAALEAIQTGAAPTVHAERRPARRWLLVAGAAVLLAVLALALDVGGWRTRLTGAPAAPKIESLAVLPLANISGDPDQEYFADGMTEALISNLAQIGGLRVISRTSVMRYKGTRQPLSEIARELNVDAVVEGSVVRSGERVRINAQLLAASPETHLWAKDYERDLRDVLTLQSEVARAIAEEIKVRLTPEESVRLTRTRPVNPEAYELYLQGVFLWNKFFLTEKGLQLCQEFLEKAIEKDPGHAPAYTALAGCTWEGALQGILPARQANVRVRELVRRALELDSTLAEAQTIDAAVRFYHDWDWDAAGAAYRQVIQNHPNYAYAHRLYGFYLLWMGRAPESVPSFRRALDLDPRSTNMQWSLAYGLLFSERQDEAIAQLKRTLESDPDDTFTQYMLAVAYLNQSKVAEAVAAAEKSVATSGGSPNFRAALGRAYVAAGRTQDAARILDELLQLRVKGQVRATDLAGLCASLGRKDEAFRWLEEGYRERESSMVFLKVSHTLDHLRGDPRFEQLLRRMNFPP